MIPHHVRQDVPDPRAISSLTVGADPASSTLGVMARLRAATSSAHSHIEQNPRLASLMTPDVTETSYLDVLLRYHAYFTRIEPGLFAKLETLIPAGELDKRRKTPLLEIDLRELGALECISPAPTPPVSLMSTGQALGRLYVHEGASLGGRVIHTALNRNLGQERLVSSRFLEGYGRDSAEVWRCTRAFIEIGISGELELSDAISAAITTFLEIDQAMYVGTEFA